MEYRVKPVLGGSFGMVRDDIRFRGGDPSVAAMVPSLLFLLEAGGRQLVVDTAFGELAEVEEMGLVAQREKPYAAILAAAGILPERVEALILTHTHWDHAANLARFPNAKIYCQAKEWAYAFSEEAAYQPALLEAFRQNEGRFVFLQGDAAPWPGIRLLASGGHTPGSQMVAVATQGGVAIISGDEVMAYRNADEMCPVGLCSDAAAIEKALRRATRCPDDFLLPSHDYGTLCFNNNPESCRVVAARGDL